jgi:hypothetical protein
MRHEFKLIILAFLYRIGHKGCTAMTLSVEILSVESVCNGVRVHGQGTQKSAPDWASIHTCEFVIPTTNSAAYYVGRIITVEITP